MTRRPSARSSRFLFAAFAAAALGLSALEVFQLHGFQPLEHRLLDAFVRWHAARLAPDPDIVVVDIDERSLARMQEPAGRFPWPRVVYAELLEGLMAQKPRAVVFDLMFSEADKFRPESDHAFIEAALPHRNVFFPMLRLDPRDDANGVRARKRLPCSRASSIRTSCASSSSAAGSKAPDSHAR